MDSPGSLLYVKLSDLLSIEPKSSPRLLLTGVKAIASNLRSEIIRALNADEAGVDDGLVPWLREKRSFGDRVSQLELEQYIDPAWLRAHQIVDGESIPRLLSKIAEGAWKPRPPQRGSSATKSSSENYAKVKVSSSFQGPPS
jgi:hypothetical protein